ncbi:MAG: hypothetical protein CMO64_00045 [Verrucomicrobiales bacterium]|nr:hypothetical protein [Verrucomicrobiales bacterium]
MTMTPHQPGTVDANIPVMDQKWRHGSGAESKTRTPICQRDKRTILKHPPFASGKWNARLL